MGEHAAEQRPMLKPSIRNSVQAPIAAPLRSAAALVSTAARVYQTAGLPHDGTQLKEITVRGRTAPIVVRTVLKAANLATLFERATAGSMAAA